MANIVCKSWKVVEVEKINIVTKQFTVLHKDLVLINWQLMSALASLERFGECNPFFINWRSCRHCLQSEWPLISYFLHFKLFKEFTICCGSITLAINIKNFAHSSNLYLILFHTPTKIQILNVLYLIQYVLLLMGDSADLKTSYCQMTTDDICIRDFPEITHLVWKMRPACCWNLAI